MWDDFNWIIDWTCLHLSTSRTYLIWTFVHSILNKQQYFISVSTADLAQRLPVYALCTCLYIRNKFIYIHMYIHVYVDWAEYVNTYRHMHIVDNIYIHTYACMYVAITTRRLINRPRNRLDRCLRLPQPSADADGSVDADADVDSDASAKTKTAQ